MLQKLANIWKIKELRNRILFTLAMLTIYRIGFHIPVPGVDPAALTRIAARSDGLLSGLSSYMSMFTGGGLSQSTIFGLGVMPYISASIIFQLMGSVHPALKELKKEGPSGQQKIMEWTRYSTVLLCMVQSVMWLGFMQSGMGSGEQVVYESYAGTMIYWVAGVAALTGGSLFLMWLGEQIDRYGIGNGVSLIITGGIITSFPGVISKLVTDGIDTMSVLFLCGIFVAVVAGAVMVNQAQRRIPIQQAKHTKGGDAAGAGQKMFLPLKVNHGGVMPIIFASTLMMFPGIVIGWGADSMGTREAFVGDGGSSFRSFLYSTMEYLQMSFGSTSQASFPFLMTMVLMIYFFCYFWVSVQFNPEDTATQLRDSGSFIPGLRPGPRTAEYLDNVMTRITYAGGAFLAVIAIMPNLVSNSLNLEYMTTQFLGGTSLLIIVSVMLDLVQRIEAQLMMRNYQGLMVETPDGTPGSGSKSRVRADRRVLDSAPDA